MSNERPAYAYPLGTYPGYGRYTERETWAQDDELARGWAFGVVEEAINRKVEKDVYPILIGEGRSYKEGWGFKSLLGAMWLQMRMFMLGDKSYGQCPRCNEPFYKSPRHKKYCSATCGNRASAARTYERKRQSQRETLEETKRRLRE